MLKVTARKLSFVRPHPASILNRVPQSPSPQIKKKTPPPPHPPQKPPPPRRTRCVFVA